jgi:ketosteroid isomerase-like protein
MNDTARNKELILRFWNSRPDKQADFLTDDAVWHLPTSVGQRVFGGVSDLRGDDARAIFTAATAANGVYEPGGSMDILHVVAEDDLVTLHFQLHTRTRAGHDYHGSYHMLFRVEHDRIAEAWEFLDTAYLEECVTAAVGE